MSLRLKLLAPLLLIAALMGGYLYGVWVPGALADAQAQHLVRVQNHLDSVGEGLVPLLSSGQLDALHENLAALTAKNKDWVDIRLLDEHGRQLYPLISAAAPAAPPEAAARRRVDRRIDFIGVPLGTLSVLIDFAESQAKDRENQRQLGVTLGIMLGIFLLSVWATLEFNVRRPVGQLALAAERLARRDFEARLPPGKRDEIGTLTEAFAAMRTDLREHQDSLLRDISERMRIEAELARHRTHLEELVAERTRELEGKNQSLGQALELVKQTQDELIQSEKMASLGRLVAGFAHEINTPIGVAVGASSHALETSKRLRPLLKEDEIDERVLQAFVGDLDEACRLVHSNLARAADLVGRFKRTSVDQTRGTARRYNLAETLADVVASLLDVLKRTPVQVDVVCPAGIELYGYPGALGQIVTNLIINSLHHGFAKGTRPGKILIAAGVDGGEVVIDYRDDGAGMDAATRSRLFEPFFTTARDTGGTGLGLFICHNLATSELKGAIRCESEPGPGVHFVLRYPGESSAKTT